MKLECSSEVKDLPDVHEAFGSVPSFIQKKKSYAFFKWVEPMIVTRTGNG